MNIKILITGGAGFIGFHLAKKLLTLGYEVTIVDNLNSYYNRTLKIDRLSILKNFPNLNFEISDISLDTDFKKIMHDQEIDTVFHLAAQAGVRYSFQNPSTYLHSNVVGTSRLLDAIEDSKVKKLIFSSTSSVYGDSNEPPFKENMSLTPIQYYALTKKFNEEQIYFYSQNFFSHTQSLIFRLFTVYGPWGRPDMALFKFVKNMLDNKPIDVYNNGNHNRSFTFIDDVVYYLTQSLDIKILKNCNVYNLGNPISRPLIDLISISSEILNIKPSLNHLPIQRGDMENTKPDVTKLISDFNSHNFISLEEGIEKFIIWYKNNLIYSTN